MKDKLTFSTLLLLPLFLTLAPTALASTTWYVDEVHGSNGNNCKSRASACKTGSAQQSVKVRILRGFLKSDEFGLSGCHALCFQQQVVEIAVAATTTQ